MDTCLPLIHRYFVLFRQQRMSSNRCCPVLPRYRLTARRSLFRYRRMNNASPGHRYAGAHSWPTNLIAFRAFTTLAGVPLGGRTADTRPRFGFKYRLTARRSNLIYSILSRPWLAHQYSCIRSPTDSMDCKPRTTRPGATL